MPMNTEISVICPNYNNAAHLSKCLQSVIKQNFKRWELIIVDDNSTDESVIIIRDFIKKNPTANIILIQHQVNKGVDEARFAGIRQSKGSCLAFIDSDDMLSPNALTLLYDKMLKEDADVVYGSFVRFIGYHKIFKGSPSNNSSHVLRADTIELPYLFDDYFSTFFGDNQLSVSMWGKLYKKSVFEKANLQPSGFKMGEDLMVNMKLHPFLKKICFIPETVYYYRFGGMTNTSNPYFLRNIKEQYLIKKQMVETYHYDKAVPFYKYELINCFYSHCENLILLDRKNEKDVRNFIASELKDPLYQDACINTWDDEKVQCVKSSNVEGVIRIVKRQIKANQKRRLLTKMIYNFANLLTAGKW